MSVYEWFCKRKLSRYAGDFVHEVVLGIALPDVLLSPELSDGAAVGYCKE